MRQNILFKYNALYSMGTEESDNVLIKGNNKDILPQIVNEYGGKVKCVYIDPPYNNGDSYHYYNDNISESEWIRDIKDVLMYLKMLLTKDGSIWISIDDKEMAYLKVEADKIFGRENFAGTIIWQQRKTRENRAVFSYNHEYILVYAKDIKRFKKSRNLLPVDGHFINNAYKNPDNDPRGPWQSITASVQAGHAVPNQFYTIVSPKGIKHNPPKGRCWVYNEERMKNEIAQGNIWFGKDGNKSPRIKKFLSAAKIGLTPQTLWFGDNYGTTDSAKKHLLSLFHDSEKVFDTPKPEELIKHILEIATNEGDIVLDCYLGSGTTLAAAHKLNRKYIGIEIGEQMTNLVVKRLRRVIEGEQGGISKDTGWNGGGNFAFFSFENATKIVRKPKKDSSKKIQYHQLDLFSLFEKYGEESLIDNKMIIEDQAGKYCMNRNVLVSLIGKKNEKEFLDRSAIIFHTGRKFPSSIVLGRLHYFVPYIKGKGIRDLWIIKNARLICDDDAGMEKSKKSIQIMFEIEYANQLFDKFIPINLAIWSKFTNATMQELIDLPPSEQNKDLSV